MNPVEEDILMHYGMPRRSGRYPWGSGDNPYQHSGDFLSRVEELRKQGFTYTDEDGKTWTGDTAIAKSMGLSTTDFRTEIGLAKSERRMLQVARAKSLKEDGLGYTEIGREMGIRESTVRSLLNPKSEDRMNQARKTADFIKEQIDKKGMIDVAAGVERELGVSKERLDQALYILQREGYPLYGGRIPQVTNPGNQTTQKVICPPGTQAKEIYDYSKVHSLTDYVSHDGGDTFKTFVYPKSLDSKRLMIRYDEDGGTLKDGVIELRRGVKDISLGEDHYAQVRILVDGKKYLKGMAIYSDDMPDGVDVVFNTNKKREAGMEEALKDIKEDPSNPFGSLIKAGGQSYYIDENGKEQLSLINKRASEGDWTEWKDAVPSQFLSKQNLTLAKKQLKLAIDDKMAEYDEICSLTNPTVKKILLDKFANDCDSTAVHLQAAALPGQKYHVIIPVNSLRDDEVYAPKYENGSKVALIRYPHGGTFEIPIVTVNNKHAGAKKLLGPDIEDAIAINKNVADRLSGADFDGDTVMVIPTRSKSGKVISNVTSTDPLKGLEGFDPKAEYPAVEGMRVMSKINTQREMGKISNLITDMTLQGATSDELARAVRHSMVVIDAEKHKLNYKKSEFDNNIAALKKDYQEGGASTLISRAKSPLDVDKRQGTPKVNLKGKEWYDPNRPEGSLIYKKADDADYVKTTVNKRTGEVTSVVKTRKQKSTKMAETDDARTLISRANTQMEQAYADYANKMKSMANQARKEISTAGKIEFSSSAKTTYQKEVDSLNAKLNTALLNAPRERQAQRQANAEIANLKATTTMEKGDITKAGQRALTSARVSVGSIARRDRSINITDREWEAIQAGAISEKKLTDILNNTDISVIREKATPRATTTLSATKINKIKQMSTNNKYSLNEIAMACGVSAATVTKYLKGEA